ncbi:MAG: FkbM family methyltransferase [Rhodospirillales bacterium]
MSHSVIHRAFRGLIRGAEKGLRGISQDTFIKVAADAVQTLDLRYHVQTRKGTLNLWCDSETSRIRAREMLRREPDTLAWIESFSPDDVLLDVGANVGVFSLYAAHAAGCRVISLEPLPFNYVALVRNSLINGFDGLITPLCVAVSDKTQIADLHLSSEATMTGGANCSFAEAVDNYGRPIEVVQRVPIPGYAIDDLIRTFDLPFPTRFKFDIDGLQEQGIRGAEKTLADERLREAMIEIPPGRDRFEFFKTLMEGFGYRLDKTVGSSPNQGNDVESATTNNFFVR